MGADAGAEGRAGTSCKAALVSAPFLAWLAFLVGASWCGFALAEAGRFSATAAIAAGVVVASAVASVLARAPVATLPGSGWIGVAAAALVLSLFPVVDTTLLSQDASIHRASGRWLARSGTLAMPDPGLAAATGEIRIGLFEFGAIGLSDVSLSRLPGGIVLPDINDTVAYPSFAHLLMVWIAIADSCAGDAGVAAVGPLFAFTAWWAVGLYALASGSLVGALATVVFLAVLLPEHWFARFLMPEIVAQALVWGGAAAAVMAVERSSSGSHAAIAVGREDEVSSGESSAAARRSVAWDERARSVAALVGGASLGVAAFARLEQLTIFVPCLLVARALLPGDRRILPRGAWLPFVAAAIHAVAHLWLVPTDYGKRIMRVVVDAVAFAWVVLGGTETRVAASLAGIGLVSILLAVALRRLRRGLAMRLFAGALGGILFASILSSSIPEGLPGLRWLAWYVPWPAWVGAAMGVWPIAMPSGLGLALFLEGLDQVASPRVTTEQIWAARRLVTVVLPLVAIAAGWAVARRDRVRPPLRSALGIAALALAVALSGWRVAGVAGREIQAGGAALAREVAAAVPPDARVLLAKPLDWLHLAPELWLESGRDVLVAREAQLFPPALDWYLHQDREGALFALGGGVVSPDGAVDERASLPNLPDGWIADEVRSFRWETRLLERSSDRAPSGLVDATTRLRLFRLRPPPARGRGEHLED